MLTLPKTRAASVTTSPRHVGTERTELAGTSDHRIRMSRTGRFPHQERTSTVQCAAHGHARGFAVATNRVTRSSYFLLLRPCLTLEPGDPFVGGRINRNGGREEASKSMERRSDVLVGGHAHQRSTPSAASTSVN